MDYLKEREGMKESEVIAELTKNAGELRRKCIDSLPVYLKDIDEKARWNKETRENREGNRMKTMNEQDIGGVFYNKITYTRCLYSRSILENINMNNYDS